MVALFHATRTRAKEVIVAYSGGTFVAGTIVMYLEARRTIVGTAQAATFHSMI